jgi:DNA-binding NtrC family response regulator/predicted hydrocarbon binding protein
VRATDLDLDELLQVDPAGGILRFGTERVLLLDAVALGLLRRELIDTLGAAGARTVLTRLGYAHGWRTAENLLGAFPWDSEEEWRIAGSRLHTLQGFVRVVAPTLGPTEITPTTVYHWVWEDSYEAEQHLLHLGPAEEAVCWTLTGFVSGYSSRAYGREVYIVEHECRGMGAPVCRLEGRSVEGWGDAIAPHLPFYKDTSLDAMLTHVTAQVKRAERRLRARQRELHRSEGGTGDVGSLIAKSEATLRVLELAQRVAQVDSTVLLTGESGVGKERIAHFIHERSARTAGPFVALNCGAVPENLLESELFGHTRGSFTGATQDRVGMFEAANGGTLLLDEIGEVPPVMQVKLLRVLQEREIRRVGENRNRPVDVRVLAATNRDLLSEIRAARFREDLYYRLRVVEIRVPPLRERPEDILSLARSFLDAAAARTKHKVTGFTPAAAQQLLAYPWPGNVRELANAVERAVVFARRSRVDVEDLPPEIGLAVPEPAAGGQVRTLAQVERDYIASVLRAVGGNRAKAAAALGIGTATLYRKLKRTRSAAGAHTGPNTTVTLQ